MQRILDESFDSADDQRLGMAVAFIGLKLVRQARAPIPLWKFSQRLALEAGVDSTPDLGRLSDSVKTLLVRANHPQLAVTQSSSSPGVGYVFDRSNPYTWPVRASR